MSNSSERRKEFGMLGAGLVLLASLGVLLAAVPDRGIGAGVAIAPPSAPELASFDEATNRSHEIIEWATTGIALAFSETTELDTLVRLNFVVEPSLIRRLAETNAEALRRFGLPNGAELHDIELTGFSQRSRGKTLSADVAWVALALEPGELHEHIKGASFRARIDLERHPAQWRVTAFELLDASP